MKQEVGLMVSQQNGQNFRGEFLPIKPRLPSVDLAMDLAQAPRNAS
jgi:hypothetical protein